MKHFFSFGGESSDRYHLSVRSASTLDGAGPELEEFIIPGRDGSLFQYNDRRENVTVSYETLLRVPKPADLPSFTGDIKRWLMSSPGEYRRLEDSYDPDHFRLAVYIGRLSMERKERIFTEQTIEFSCLPYRYRKSGEVGRELSWNGRGKFENDTRFDALPVIHVSIGSMGNNTPVQICVESGGNVTCLVNIPAYEQGELVVDSEKREAILTNAYGSQIAFGLEKFPVLAPGDNYVSVTGGRMQRAAVIPRWREL